MILSYIKRFENWKPNELISRRFAKNEDDDEDNEEDDSKMVTSEPSPVVTPVMGRPKKAKTPRLGRPRTNTPKNKG